ncbi:hypothetical protein A0H81_07631 [Grifola frondosa]|uniref:Uncharacterized protein n=1 Tax=Grifola frondosa TaxID=5627 RepID=A0A1C7M5G9_GRIFR|nr:hypothetical protein A0H81_07631 [Grifola frondosa]
MRIRSHCVFREFPNDYRDDEASSVFDLSFVATTFQIDDNSVGFFGTGSRTTIIRILVRGGYPGNQTKERRYIKARCACRIFRIRTSSSLTLPRSHPPPHPTPILVHAHLHLRMLSTFYAWSIEHIKRVFEAKTERDCLEALDDTFSQKLEFTFNGSPLPRMGLQKIVLAMLEGSGFCLNVDWQNAVEVPNDGYNRNGILGGYYIIRNVKKPLPGSSMPGYFERHKSVNVVIESESPDIHVDSRRIVKLAIVATDLPAPPLRY